MSDIEEFYRRIVTAMDRVAGGLEYLGPIAGNPIDEDKTIPTLEQALENEKALNARLSAQMATLDLELQRVRQSNEALRQSNQDLCAANAEGLADPNVINAGMAAELEGLRATRASETSEVSAIIEVLTPLLNESEGAA